jgi:hypothetical protein
MNALSMLGTLPQPLLLLLAIKMDNLCLANFNRQPYSIPYPILSEVPFEHHLA